MVQYHWFNAKYDFFLKIKRFNSFVFVARARCQIKPFQYEPNLIVVLPCLILRGAGRVVFKIYLNIKIKSAIFTPEKFPVSYCHLDKCFWNDTMERIVEPLNEYLGNPTLALLVYLIFQLFGCFPAHACQPLVE